MSPASIWRTLDYAHRVEQLAYATQLSQNIRKGSNQNLDGWSKPLFGGYLPVTPIELLETVGRLSP